MAAIVLGGLHNPPFQIYQSGGFEVYYADAIATTDDILTELIKCCDKLTKLAITNQSFGMQNLTISRAALKCCKDTNQKVIDLYSAIRDIRREQLRGKRGTNK